MTKSWQPACADALARGQITETGVQAAELRRLAELRDYRLGGEPEIGVRLVAERAVGWLCDVGTSGTCHP
ncbi:hypothetical protein ACFP81_05190 [Deinococcus lacus]|uniref:Uncharacterized protein n=1 Tax=Deinococcus lacus TaxID=392561 RepID=A0ABW1YAY6_9DEIO